MSGQTSATVLVTGGAGFIGSAVVRRLIDATGTRVVNLDRLGYASSLAALAEVADDPRYTLERADIADAGAVRRVFEVHEPDAVLHLAAESHVDRSIEGPDAFVHSNLVGTSVLLQEAHRHWRALPAAARERFRFVQVSTDEVFGSLGDQGRFDERSPYAPRSPYAATKAGADHLAAAWHHTYGLPVLTTYGCNTYGPWQFPEKLVPLMIVRGLRAQTLPVYGDGQQVRDWLHVEDHAAALLAVLERGTPGRAYCVGAGCERRNLELVRTLCQLLDQLAPDPAVGSRERLIRLVEDRPGHDRRYAMDATRIREETGWSPRWTLDEGLRGTVRWYLEHRDWWEARLGREYDAERLGLREQHGA